MSELRPETELIVGGRPEVVPDGPLNAPISPASALRPGGESGYARSGSPAWEPLETVVGRLEDGHAVAFASGMAAAHAAFRLFPPDPTVVAPEVAYMAVRESLQIERDAGRAGVRFVDITETAAVKAACDGANVLWLESPTNPTLEVADLPALAAAARERGVLTVCDNTFATPLLQQPLDLGVDVVVHSATKYLSGHSDVLLGVAVTQRADLYTALQRRRLVHGGIAGPMEAWLALRGLRTLHVRFERQCANAVEIARRAEGHPAVDRVRYPGFGAMVSIEARGGAAAADAVATGCRLWLNATSLGGVESLIERRRKYAAESPTVPEALLRLSVGIEDVDDLWRDLSQALDAATG